MKNIIREPKCWICKDEGLIIYKKEYMGITYDMACRCSCKEGWKVVIEYP